jgi:hypothetical protein
MTAEELLHRWAAKKLNLPEDEIIEVIFRHEEGYTNDSGTSWPEENWAVVTVKGQGKRTRQREIYTENYSGIPELLKEILES